MRGSALSRVVLSIVLLELSNISSWNDWPNVHVALWSLLRGKEACDTSAWESEEAVEDEDSFKIAIESKSSGMHSTETRLGYMRGREALVVG